MKWINMEEVEKTRPDSFVVSKEPGRVENTDLFFKVFFYGIRRGPHFVYCLFQLIWSATKRLCPIPNFIGILDVDSLIVGTTCEIFIIRHVVPPLFFFSYPFKRCAIGFLVNEPTCVSIPLDPGLVFWIVGLASVLNHSISVTVSGRWICSHSLISFCRLRRGIKTPSRFSVTYTQIGKAFLPY